MSHSEKQAVTKFCYTNCGLEMRSMGILWDFAGNADSQASPQIYGIRIYVFA